jgi:hypothetical protein
MQCNEQPVPDLGESTCQKAPRKVPKLPNTTFVLVIRRALNGHNDQLPSSQLQASYPDVRHWEELIDFIKNNSYPKKPYCLTAIYNCNLMQTDLDEQYMRLYATGQIINDCLSGQIAHNSSLLNVFKLKLEHNVKLLW